MSSIWTDEQTGPNPYVAGGFTITTTLTAVDHASVRVKTPGANLPPCEFRISRSGATFTVQIFKHQFDDVGTIDAVTGLDGSLTLKTASGQTYNTEAAHVHSMAHDHVSTASAGVAGASGGAMTDLTSPVSVLTHTHNFDPPNYTGNTGAASAHTHTWDSLYQHQHAVSQTATNAAQTELTGLDLSGTTFIFRALDQS